VGEKEEGQRRLSPALLGGGKTSVPVQGKNQVLTINLEGWGKPFSLPGKKERVTKVSDKKRTEWSFCGRKSPRKKRRKVEEQGANLRRKPASSEEQEM